MTAEKTEAPRDERKPDFGGLIVLKKEGWDGIPDTPNPFYFGAEDGLFKHVRGLLGRGVTKNAFWPDAFPKWGLGDFAYTWDAPVIPKELMGQIVNFFERVYDYQHTEAAVLLVMHSETKEWRAFVPTQTVSHGGVNYVFDPSHIKYPWVLVGSIHSHCDFGAGHSSTDTGDASGFDGFHATIGMIKRDIPQIVAMMSMGKKFAHYKDETFPKLFDFSEPKAHKAPDWWDRYVEDVKENRKPVGFELYEKFKKPSVVKNESVTVIKPVTQGPVNHAPIHHGSGYRGSEWSWNAKASRMVHSSWKVDENGFITMPSAPETKITLAGHKPKEGSHRPLGTDKDDWTEFYRLQGLDGAPEGYEGFPVDMLLAAGFRWDPNEKTWEFVGGSVTRMLAESEEFNARQTAERGLNWSGDGSLARESTIEDLKEMGLWGASDDFWEEILPKDIVDVIGDSEMLSDDDMDFAQQHPHLAGTVEFWREVYLAKVIRASQALRGMGVDLNFRVESLPKDIDIELLPDETKRQAPMPLHLLNAENPRSN
jgi:hypothetical protein